MVQLNKKFAGIMTKYGTAHLIFQLNNTDAPMEGITNMKVSQSIKAFLVALSFPLNWLNL
jgi:hypothetical protein